MNEWEVVLVIGSLLTLILAVTGPVVKLNNNITKLNVVLDGLKEDMGELKAAHARDVNELRKEGADKRQRIHENIEKLDARIQTLERKL